MSGKEGESVQEVRDEVGNLSVELKAKLSLEEQQKLAKAKHWRMLEEEIEYYKSLITTKVESLLISEDYASYYPGGVDEIRRINKVIREQDRMTKDLAFNLLKKHGIKRGYIKYDKDSDVPLDFLKFLAKHMK